MACLLLSSGLRVGRLVTAILLTTALSAHAESAGNEQAQAIEHARRATVGILSETPLERQAGYQSKLSVRGSGVHLQHGYIVTARHAVEKDAGNKTVLPQQIVVLTGNLSELTAQLVGGSAYLDIALYQVDDAHRAQLPAGVGFAPHEAIAGDPVFTVGYPLGWGPAITYGRIGNPNVFLPTTDTRLLQSDLAACSGNSGGGLFTSDGTLAGIMHAIIKTEQSQADHRCSQLAFSVPATLVQRIVVALMEGRQPGFSRLGIQMAPVRIGTRWHVRVGEASGPAKEGGAQKGDLLMAINGTDITDPAQLKNYLMERTLPGQTVTLSIQRGDQKLSLSIVLGGA